MNNNRYKVLVVDVDEATRSLVASLLEANGYRTIHATTFAEAKTMFSSYIPDLILLALDLPDSDGSALVEHVRDDDLTPIIVISRRTEESEKVRLLDMGANDYVTKPFGVNELMARVRSAIRNYRHRATEGRLPGGKFTLKDIVIDYDARRLFLSDREVKLTQTEYNIIALLSEHCGKMMSYSDIIKAIWREYPDEGNIKRLQVNMANIRKKLGVKPGENKYIVNELGVGYRLQEK